MAAGLAALANSMTSLIIGLGPHVGEGHDLATIAMLMDSLLSGAASVGSRLK